MLIWYLGCFFLTPHGLWYYTSQMLSWIPTAMINSNKHVTKLLHYGNPTVLLSIQEFWYLSYWLLEGSVDLPRLWSMRVHIQDCWPITSVVWYLAFVVLTFQQCSKETDQLRINIDFPPLCLKSFKTKHNMYDPIDGAHFRHLGWYYPTIYKALAPSKRWLALGFLNHQQYQNHHICIPIWWWGSHNGKPPTAHLKELGFDQTCNQQHLEAELRETSSERQAVTTARWATTNAVVYPWNQAMQGLQHVLFLMCTFWWSV